MTFEELSENFMFVGTVIVTLVLVLGGTREESFVFCLGGFISLCGIFGWTGTPKRVISACLLLLSITGYVVMVRVAA